MPLTPEKQKAAEARALEDRRRNALASGMIYMTTLQLGALLQQQPYRDLATFDEQAKLLEARQILIRLGDLADRRSMPT